MTPGGLQEIRFINVSAYSLMKKILWWDLFKLSIITIFNSLNVQFGLISQLNICKGAQ